MRIDIWSDVVCPWCYIGKRRLETALARFEHRDKVELSFRSFELDPDAPAQEEAPLDEMLAEKYGMSLEDARNANERITGLAAAEGLQYRLDLVRRGNSFNAHRLIHFAANHGLQGEMKERLMRAYFTEGAAIGNAAVLQALAEETGLEADAVRAFLQTDELAEEVRQDEEEARALGIRGVPFFVIEGKWAISGAQPAMLFLEALGKTWTEVHAESAG